MSQDNAQPLLTVRGLEFAFGGRRVLDVESLRDIGDRKREHVAERPTADLDARLLEVAPQAAGHGLPVSLAIAKVRRPAGTRMPLRTPPNQNCPA